MTMAELIRAKLETALHPKSLEVEDDSARHAGHMGHPGHAYRETHFNVKVVASAFEGKNRADAAEDSF